MASIFLVLPELVDRVLSSWGSSHHLEVMLRRHLRRGRIALTHLLALFHLGHGAFELAELRGTAWFDHLKSQNFYFFVNCW